MTTGDRSLFRRLQAWVSCEPPALETSAEDEHHDAEAGTRDREMGRKFNRSVAWNTASKVSTRGMQFVVTIVLARLLTPADFGLCGMASMVTMFTLMFVEFGFAHALVQKPEISHEDICTGLSISVGLGAVMTTLLVLAAPLFAMLFRDGQLTAPLRVVAFDIVLGSLAIAPRALLYRRFDFRSVMMADFAAAISYAVVAVGLALAHAGVWSIVIGTLAMSVFQVAALWLRAGYRFQLRIDRESAKALMPFGARMVASDFADFLRGNLDYFVVGRVLGPASLGVYTIAFKVADFPRSRLASIVGDVALPAMSSVQESDDALRRTYRRAVSMSALFSFPALLALTLLAPEFISSVYGPKWVAAVPVLQILMPMGLLLAVCQPGTMILVATGRPQIFFRLALLYAAGVGGFAAIGVRFGITGVAAGVMAATVVYFLTFQWTVWRTIGIGAVETVRAVIVPTLGSALMLGVLYVYTLLVPFPGDVRGLPWLVGATAVGGVCYAATALPAAGINPWARLLPSRRTTEPRTVADEATTG